MQIKYNYTRDYIEALSFAGFLSISRNQEIIQSVELLGWVYYYLENHKFSKLFWKYIGIDDKLIVKDYFSENYQFNPKNLSKKEKSKAQLDSNLFESLKDFQKFWLKKLDFLSLLYMSFSNLPKPVIEYFDNNDIDVLEVKDKIFKLATNKKLIKVGTINLFKILQDAVANLWLGDGGIEMFIKIDDLDVGDYDDDQVVWEMEEIYSWPDSELVEWSANSDTQINTDLKTDVKKLTIEHFGNELTLDAKNDELDPVIWRHKEIQQLIYTLLRKTKNNPLLIWEAWVGKTAIVEWLAIRIANGEVPDKLKNKRLFVLDMGSLLAWTKYRWEFEARLKAILDEAADSTNNIIMFIDELHTIIGAWNAEWSADAANMLKPLLSRWKIQLIGATTFDEYQKHIEKDPALKRRFQEVIVDESTREDSKEILSWVRERFEEFHWVVISDEAIDWAIDLSIRYLMNKHLPDKAFDLIDEACARKSTLIEKLKNNDEYSQLEKELTLIHTRIETAILNQDYFAAAELKEKEEKVKTSMKSMKAKNVLPKYLRPVVSYNDIGWVLAEKLWVPVDKVNESETQKLRDLDNTIQSKVFGQDEAVQAVVKAIRRNRLSVVHRTKPISSFLFLWPSWVGKTFLAKILATEYFGDEKSLIRVDMSEFMEKHSSSKLIGSAPGYVGYDEGWVLTEAVRRKPYSVVLFDEIEKASPEVLNILLQVMDEWHLKDNKWRWIDFKNTIIILTSNIWSEEFGKKIPKIWFDTTDVNKSWEENFLFIKDKIMEKVKEYLTPELMNRLDSTVIFRPLSKEILTDIFNYKYKDFVDQWKVKDTVKLTAFTKPQISKIIDEIYDPQYWARPIERYIYDKIEPDLIEQLLAQ